MQLNSDVFKKATYLTGNSDIAAILTDIPSKEPFSEDAVEYLNAVSKLLMKDPRSRIYSDVITFAFWIRKGSTLKLKERFETDENSYHLGKGVAFHIAPSNVPVNFAYSLAAGILTGNANIVRVPSKDFQQVSIIVDALNKAFDEYESMRHYVLCVKYGRDKEINDVFSSIADIRVIWGGDQTISELRKSPLPPRSGEITFADRYSLAVIDSNAYLEMENKDRIAEDFYNDTFFSDQNACTSPRIVVWLGSKIEEAKALFWKEEHALAKRKYNYQSIQGINKLTKAYMIAASEADVSIEDHPDNLIFRISVSSINGDLMEYRDNSGYFYEYNCKNIMELMPLCNDKRCQTIGYIGTKDVFTPLISAGVKGVDRIVPIGRTMDFDLIWDGYDLPAMMTRTVVLI